MRNSIYRVCATGFILIASFVITPQMAVAGSCTTSCTGVIGSGMTCMVTAMLTCPSGFPVYLDTGTVIAVSSYGANCAVGAADDLMATATHMAGDGTNGGTYAVCVFQIHRICGDGMAGLAQDAAICTVNASGDGLPVELLEFSVDISD